MFKLYLRKKISEKSVFCFKLSPPPPPPPPLKLGRPMSDVVHGYSEISQMAKLSSLKSFGTYQKLLLFHKVINNLFNSPELLSKINIRVPGKHLRYNINTFSSTLKIYDANKLSFIGRSSLSANSISDKIDICNYL